MEPLLTVITVVRNIVLANRVDTFRQCIESVHCQDCIDEIEHIVVDGESTDGTDEILKEYTEKGWIRVIRKADHSIYEAMNNGLEVARGKYVLFLNSDDYFFNNSGLGKALRELDSSDADYCFGDAKISDDKDGPAGVWQGSIAGLPFARNYCHQTMIVKSKVLREYGGFDLQYKISSDSDLMLKLFKDQRPYIHSSYPFACYRLGGASSQQHSVSQSDHAKSFYRHFGHDAGMTFDDCMGLWDFSILKGQEFRSIRDILDKLPAVEWRIQFEQKLSEIFDFHLSSGQKLGGGGLLKKRMRLWRLLFIIMTIISIFSSLLLAFLH